MPKLGTKAQSIIVTGATHSGELPCSLAVGSYVDLQSQTFREHGLEVSIKSFGFDSM